MQESAAENGGKKENSGKGFKSWFQRDNLIILVLLGILLFVIALPVKKTDHVLIKEGEKTQADTVTKTVGQETVPADEVIQEEDYVTYLEQRLQEILKRIEGVGEVKVMITLQSSEERVIEKDKPVNRSNTNETDAQGGSRIITQLESHESTIYQTNGNGSEPYVVKTILPKIEGVVVVAKGAGNGDINRCITEIVQTLFDVEAHKVQVVKMK